MAIDARSCEGNGSSCGQVRLYQLEGLNITNEPAVEMVVNNNDGTFSFDPGSNFQDPAEGEPGMSRLPIRQLVGSKKMVSMIKAMKRQATQLH